MFRNERPQHGRFKQFHQFGAEIFGVDNAAVDAEIILYATTILKAFGLSDYTVHINSIGTEATQTKYKKELKKYLENKLDNLCDDCKVRYEKNPLRILDCKKDGDSDTLRNAPVILDYLSEEDKAHFDEVCEFLTKYKIPFKVDKKLVRGLDYYTKTVFEIKMEIAAQGTVCGGGRYNNLVKSMEGPDVPAAGFAYGLERLIEIIQDKYIEDDNFVHLYIMVLDKDLRKDAYSIMHRLRLRGIICESDFEAKSMKSQFKMSSKVKARFVGLFGASEKEQGVVKIKDQESGVETPVKISNLENILIDMIRRSE